MIKKGCNILLLLVGIFVFPQVSFAQVDFNKTPDDDLGVVEDKFQEFFFEALKQKGIENYEKSVEALQQCIALDKSPAVLYFELGKNYMKLKNFGEAEDALKEAVDKDPDNEWYLDELYGYYVSQNELKKALKTVQQLVEYHPDYKEDLATLYLKMEKFDDALGVLDELDKAYGISISRDIMRNKIYQITGRTKDQIENLESRIEDNPEKESNYLALIYRYSENNEKEKAFETAKELLKVNPNSQVVHLALYKFYLDDDNTEEAIKSMKIVVKSNEIKPEAKLKVLSDFVGFVKEYPQYEADLVETTTLLDGKTNAKTLTDLGYYYLSKNDKAKAIHYFQEALKLNGDDFNIIKNVLLLQIDLQLFDDATQKSEEVIQKFPAQPLGYLINGVVLNARQKPNDAISVLESGLDWVIDNPKMESDFYLQLSKAYEMLGNMEKSGAFMKKAKALQFSTGN
ncbi:tetratricopeptide repeat protein [Hyunsoonleella sp. SJ7]|uniref:Tetratricopeptide repeat protein n=1 Tax=Hyunsoonleella aquatilis TaxID=2762758 RepID=A0A923KLY7_9FLAO|nr:tetratricopeptide repeat protein [Hyunsoonleella aquatilis]MBC3758450.1 tetratricopeptide repeat protein [Hyunsoonleella aquatilis]